MTPSWTTPEDVATPSASPSARNPDVTPQPTRPTDTSTSGEEESDVLLWVGRGALVVLGLGLLAVPALVRVLLRRRRLGGAHPDGVA